MTLSVLVLFLFHPDFEKLLVYRRSSPLAMAQLCSFIELTNLSTSFYSQAAICNTVTVIRTQTQKSAKEISSDYYTDICSATAHISITVDCNVRHRSAVARELFWDWGTQLTGQVC